MLYPDIWHDATVEAARTAGGVVPVGPWTLRLPRVFGFCGGVMNAVRSLAGALNDVPASHGGTPAGQVWLLGEIIHNETVNAWFRAAGVRLIPEPEIGGVLERVRQGDRVVIPAFGIPLPLEERLRAAAPVLGFSLIDTSCHDVRRIWDFAARHAAAGATVIVHGKPDHPETRATLSRALTPANAVIELPGAEQAAALAAAVASGDPSCLPVECLRQVERLDWSNLALVHQTTLLREEVEQVEAALAAASLRRGGRLIRDAGICRATQDRQDAALELCRAGCACLLVVGSFASSNTARLHRLAARFAPAYFISDATALSPQRIRHFDLETKRERDTRAWLPASGAIGILAGASCPPSDIGGILRRFQELARG